jgi:hypothetical protein
MVSVLLSSGVVTANYAADGVPVYFASASTPRYRVSCTEPWGTCPLSAVGLVPVPNGAVPAPGADHAMVVVDRAANRDYEFWEASKSSGSWSAGWGGVEALDGDGIRSVEGSPGATGPGDSSISGLTLISELQQGHIDHALTFVTSHTCASTFRYPAIKTDGHKSMPCIPEGARIQLDPSINVDAIAGITPGEKMIAHALQTYGAYCHDTGGSDLGFTFENPIDGQPNVYPSIGFPSDYTHMTHIPWTALRVLRNAQGT